MIKPKVYLTRKVDQEVIDRIRVFAELEVWQGDEPIPRDILLKKVEGIEGIFCMLTEKIDQDFLACAPKLKVVSTMSVGVDHIDVAACARKGIAVGHTPDVLTETTADFAFALLLCGARRIIEGVEFVKNGRWDAWSPNLLLGQDIHGSVLGIVGFGRIGMAVAKRAQGFGMRILVSHPHPLDRETSRALHVEQCELSSLLTEVDFLSLHVPLSPKTYHLISEEELKLMKPTSMLINTSRGSVVDPQALYQALLQRRIACAALDVTDPEPIPINDPLLTLPNCLIVPHIASASRATRTKMALMAAENLQAGLTGKPLPYRVNPERKLGS